MGQRQRGDHGVTGTGYVKYFPRPRRHAVVSAIGLNQDHAFFGSRGENRAGCRIRHHGPAGGYHLWLCGHRQTGSGTELAQVGSNAGGAAVAGEIGALGVDEYRNPGAAVPR